MSLKVVHKSLGPKDEIKAIWDRYEKKFWGRQTNNKIENFLTGIRDVKGPGKTIGKSAPAFS